LRLSISALRLCAEFTSLDRVSRKGAKETPKALRKQNHDTALDHRLSIETASSQTVPNAGHGSLAQACRANLMTIA
jgi:hypothetical protein